MMIRTIAACLFAGVMSMAVAQSPAPSGANATTATQTTSPQVARADAPNPLQPGNNAPVWREVRQGEAGYASLPAREAGVLILTSGQTWRTIRNGPVTWIGGGLVIAVVLALAAFYLLKGPIRLNEAPTGRRVLRFKHIERLAHWTTAISFVVLAVTGLLMLFGKHVLMPVLGHTVHGWIVILGKNVHNFVGPVFSVALVFVILIFLRDNLPTARDWLWIKKGGGLFTGEHVPSGRFNAMQKMLFWGGVVALGVIVTITGYVLDFPNFNQLRATMQTMHLVHTIAALLFVAMMLGHIYIGTIGMEGALDAMKTGYVDESWAKEHHEDWYHEVKTSQRPT
ncbi:MAG TPA: formate dehydrogenase subunit gamma [Burkholderiaceae bacterium]|nr:formate dehydrogenase subunit gamma [Burkholderiaceae bacterium]